MMSIADRRNREKTAVREKILAAARELFAARGYDAVTMRGIAERVEYSPTAIYSHFADKESLLRELCTQDFLTFSRHFQTCAQIPDPIDKLRQVAMTYLGFAADYPHHYRYMFMMQLPKRDFDERRLKRGEPSQDAYAFLKACIQEAFAAGRLQPQYADAELAAQTLWAGVHGFAALRLTMQQDGWIAWVGFERGAGAMLDVLLYGICREKGAALD
jgi:AcrR family transcriptional regulator